MVSRTTKLRFLSNFLPLLCLSCTESLPPYQDPTKLFGGSIDALYLLSTYQNEMRVVLRVRNIYDEQLDGQALIAGQVEIVAVRDQAVHKTIQLTPLDLVSAKGYDRQSGRLVFDPGEEIRFEVSWNFVDDSGRDLRSSFFVLLADTTCQARCLGYREDFTLKAQINLYERTSSVVIGPTVFALWYVTGVVAGCSPLGPVSERTLQLPPCGS